MHFYFKNVCSYIEVDLPLETEKVTVWSKSPLAGTIKVDAEGNITDTLNASNTVTLRGDLKPGKYYIAVLPGYKDSLVVNPQNRHLSIVSKKSYDLWWGKIHRAEVVEEDDGPSPWHPGDEDIADGGCSEGDVEIAYNSYTQITFQKQYGAMNFTPEDDYESVVFEFEEQPYELQVTITSDLFEKEESWGDAYYAAYYPTQYFMIDNKLSLNLDEVFYDKFAGLVNDRGETASNITTIAIQNAADGENVVYLKRVTFVKRDGTEVVLKNSEDGFDFVMEVIK